MLVAEAAPIDRKLREASLRDPQKALDGGIITAEEFEQLAIAKAAVARVIAVDTFPMAEVSPVSSQHDRAPPATAEVLAPDARTVELETDENATSAPAKPRPKRVRKPAAAE